MFVRPRVVVELLNFSVSSVPNKQAFAYRLLNFLAATNFAFVVVAFFTNNGTHIRDYTTINTLS